jgi:hypothetical protein
VSRCYVTHNGSRCRLPEEHVGFHEIPDLAAEHARLEAENADLRARLHGAESANAAIPLVDHVELNGHIELVEQCHDYLAHEASDPGDPSGKLQDFVESLRIVIDQFDKQRRSHNWYEVAYSAGKQKLIESALAKQAAQLAAVSAARDEACQIAERLAGLECDSTAEERIASLRKVGQ